jgi:hypothetical protein
MDLNKARRAVHDALFQIINEKAGAAMVTKYLCLVEVVEADGSKSMISLCSEDLSPWDRIGMIEHHSRGLKADGTES